jgi:hypothetical protein
MTLGGSAQVPQAFCTAQMGFILLVREYTFLETILYQ